LDDSCIKPEKEKLKQRQSVRAECADLHGILHKSFLATGLRPDPLGELTALPRLPSWIKRKGSGRAREGRERKGRKREEKRNGDDGTGRGGRGNEDAIPFFQTFWLRP